MASRYASAIPRAVALLGTLLLTSCGQTQASKCFSDPKVAALADAAARGDAGRIDKLVSEGVNVNAKGKDGMTLLDYAMLSGSKEGFRRLLEHKADPNLPGRDGWAAIHWAATYRDIEFLRLVLDHGGNVNLRTAKTAQPIFRAIIGGTKEHVKLLIEAGADLNCQPCSHPPIVHAANINAFDIVYMLLEAGADFTIRDKLGYSVTNPILRNNVDPNSEQGRWRVKVMEFLAARGVNFEEEKRRNDAILEARTKEVRGMFP